MMKVYEKKYVHEKERNEILAQRCNNQHEEIMMLKNKMEKLKRQADTNMKYNQDRDEDEEENLYYEKMQKILKLLKILVVEKLDIVVVVVIVRIRKETQIGKMHMKKWKKRVDC